jgi:hypothetical protein
MAEHDVSIRISDFYELTPDFEHYPGDIWEGLPTFGLLPFDARPGVVITPACDLSNAKTETITYLPIVSVRELLHSKPFLRPALNKLRDALRQTAMADDAQAIERVGYNIEEHELIEVEQRLGAIGTDEKVARAMAALAYVKSIVCPDPAASQTAKAALGTKDYDKTIDGIVRNAARVDLHFVPADGQYGARTTVTEPSCVLFRYPVTIPVDILDAANDLTQDWEAFTAKLGARYPLAATFKQRPIKKLNVKNRFFADLISRYLALYLRLGSPDFGPSQIGHFLSEIRG